MAEKKEIELPKTTISPREKLARGILKNRRLQGHTYIDLRKDGRRFVFFCTLCLSPCYSGAILHDHLNGKLHRLRSSCAKLTLLIANPWPFSDGVLFFDTSTGNEEKTPISGGECVPGSDDNRVSTSELHGDNQPAVNTDVGPSHCSRNLSVPGLLINDKTVDVGAKFIGFGRIAAKLFETNGLSTWIDKIWCEWLGDEGPSYEDKAMIPEHDFAIVTFSCYNLDQILTDSQSAESENGEDSSRKRKNPFSDPEDTNESLARKPSAGNSNSSGALVADGDDKPMSKRAIKNNKKRMKKQQKLDSDRAECGICKGKMLQGKDAAAILNLKTGKFVCGSRNFRGAIHLFHVSCVVHWFLYCENEIIRSKMVTGIGKKRDTDPDDIHWLKFLTDGSWEIFSVFCALCQGTGIYIEEGSQIERDTFPLSQVWKFEVIVAEGRKAWIKNHEKLKNCSIGFHFPLLAEQSGQIKAQEERVHFLKLIRFYRVVL